MADFKMPDVGEGLTEGDIVTWHVKAGDSVAINDVLVEVETAKSIVELLSPFAGVVTRLHFAEGETVEVGAVIVTVGENANEPVATPDDVKPDTAQVDQAIVGRGASAPIDGAPAVVGHNATEASPAETAAPAEAADGSRSVLVGYGPTKAKVARRPRRKPAARPTAAPSTFHNPYERPYATPPVRKMARELGVDLRDAAASGARGQITRADLQALAARAVTNTALAEPSETRIPITGVRKHTAEAMVVSAFTAPHVTEWVTVDVTRTLKLLDRLRADKTFTGVRLSPLVLVMRAALIALARHPEANAKWDAGAGEIVQYRDVNLGIAAATPRGLIVPNIRAAQTLTVLELANALTDLVAEARAGKTQTDRMKGGTFTITNIGVFGVDGGTPILNPGEAAILCMGQITRRPWEHKSKVKLRSTSTLALSFDHRLIDGELGSQVLRDTARLLENPEFALTW